MASSTSDGPNHLAVTLHLYSFIFNYYTNYFFYPHNFFDPVLEIQFPVFVIISNISHVSEPVLIKELSVCLLIVEVALHAGHGLDTYLPILTRPKPGACPKVSDKSLVTRSQGSETS